MKKGKVIFVLWMSLMLLMSGCSGDKTDTNDENNESSKRDKTGSEADNGIFGQVTEVGDDYIIIVQTERPGRSEGQKSGESSEDTSDDTQEQQEEITGEEQEIKIDADTVIMQTNRGMAGKGRSEDKASRKPDGEQPPEQPDGEQPDGEQPPEQPDGEQPDGERPHEESGEEITLEDISAGDRVTVIMGDDGAADEIRVMQEGAQGQEQDTDEKETI